MKRNARNIGKIIQISSASIYDGRLGKVVGFRGDFAAGDPWVNVFIFPSGGVSSFPGSRLTALKMTRDEAHAVSLQELQAGKYRKAQ